MSLATKVFRSSTLNLVEHFVQLVVVFIVTPLMISQLGEVQYGVWLVCMAIIDYYKLLDLGITLAGSRFLARSIGASDAADYQVNISTLLTIFWRIGLLTLPLSIAVAFAAPHFIKDENFSGTIFWILLVFGFSVTVRFFTRIFPVILRSHIRYDFIVAASLTKTMVQGSLLIYFLLHGAGLTTLIIIHICAELINQLLLFVFSRRISTTATITTKHYQSGRAREILRFGSTSFLASAGLSLSNGIDPLVIGSFSGLNKVPIYSIGRRFLQIFQDIINAIFGGHLLSALCQIEAREGMDGVRSNFLKMIRLCTPIVTLGGCAMAIYGPPMIECWVGPDFYSSGTILLILVVPYVVRLAQYPAWGLFQTTNRQHYSAWIGFGGGIFNLIVSLILVLQIGFMGVVWGTFIELCISYFFILPILVSRTLNISVARYITALLPGFLKAGIPSLLWFLIIQNLLLPDYLRLFLLAIGHAALVASILWFTVLHPKERQQLLSMFRRNR